MASSTSFNITSALFDAAAIALGKLGLKNPDITVRELALCIHDDAADQHDQRALDSSFFCIIASIAIGDLDFRNVYSKVSDAHRAARDAADKAAADAQAAADKAAKVAEESAPAEGIELAKLKDAKDAARRATDAAQHRYFAAVNENATDVETQAEIDLYATWKACKQAEVNSIGAYYDALRAQPKDPNDKDECCDGVSCLG